MASMSGIALDDCCVDVFKSMQMRKGPRCLIMQIKKKEGTGHQEIQMTQKHDEFSFEDLQKEFTPEDPKFVVFDYDAKPHSDGTGGGRQLILISWIPDTCKIKDKMVYASSTDTVKQKLKGWSQYIQACDHDDCCGDEIDKKIKGTRV